MAFLIHGRLEAAGLHVNDLSGLEAPSSVAQLPGCQAINRPRFTVFFPHIFDMVDIKHIFY